VNVAPPSITDPDHGRSRTVLIALILSSVTLAAIAQLTLKTGVNHVTPEGGAGLQLSGSSFRSLLTSPIVWAGLVLFGLSAVVWLFALSRATLSFAYPFASLSYVLILIFGRVALHEQVTPLRLAGVALIVAGIVLVAQTPHA
jgi:drug/metabolite transporter (DMT)-like permease